MAQPRELLEQAIQALDANDLPTATLRTCTAANLLRMATTPQPLDPRQLADDIAEIKAKLTQLLDNPLADRGIGTQRPPTRITLQMPCGCLVGAHPPGACGLAIKGIG